MGFIKSLINRLRRNPFIKNVAVLSGGTIIAQLIPVLFMPIFGRMYGPVETGIYGVYVAITNITQQVACFRFDYAIVVVDDDDEADRLFVLSCVLAIAFSVILAIVMIPFMGPIANLFNLEGAAVHSLWAVPATTLVCGLTTALTYYNIRYNKYKTISYASILKSIVQVLVQTALFFMGAGFWGLILGQLLSNFFGNARMFATLKGRVNLSMLKFPDLKRIAKRNKKYPMFMLPSALVNSLTMNIMAPTISSLYSTAQTGYYSTVNRALGLPLTMISSAVSQVFLKQASSDKKNEKNLDKTFSKITKYLALISLVPFGILFFFADPLIPFVLGDTWRPAAALFPYLIPLFAVRFVVTPLTSSAIAMGKQKETMIWQFFLFASIGIPTLMNINQGWPLETYLLTTSITMAIAYIIFYFFCFNIVKKAGVDNKEKGKGKISYVKKNRR